MSKDVPKESCVCGRKEKLLFTIFGKDVDMTKLRKMRMEWREQLG